MKGIKLFVVVVWLMVVFTGGNVLAHHAMEYIELESYTTAPQGGKLFHLHYDYYVPDKDDPTQDHWELTPGFSYGIVDRLMFDVHTHFAKFGAAHDITGNTAYETLGPSPFIEAVAAAFQYRITEPEQLPVNIAGIIEYEYAMPRSQDVLGGGNVLVGKLVVSKDFGVHSNVVLNIMCGLDDSVGFVEWGFGGKTPITDDPNGTAVGIEILGDFDGVLKAIPGIYYPIQENAIMKFGMEIGNAKSDYLRASVSLMYKF